MLETPPDVLIALGTVVILVVWVLWAFLTIITLFDDPALPIVFVLGSAVFMGMALYVTRLYRPVKEARLKREREREDLNHQRKLDEMGFSTQIKLKELDLDDNRHARQSELDRLVLTIAGQREQLEMQEGSAAALEEIRQKYGLKVETRKLLGGLQQTRITLSSQERLATDAQRSTSQDAADEHLRGMDRLGKEQQGRLDELASVQTHDLIKAMLSELLSRTDKDQQMKDLITSLEASEGVYEWANSATDPNEQRRRRATAEAAVQDILRGGKGG